MRRSADAAMGLKEERSNDKSRNPAAEAGRSPCGIALPEGDPERMTLVAAISRKLDHDRGALTYCSGAGRSGGNISRGKLLPILAEDLVGSMTSSFLTAEKPPCQVLLVHTLDPSSASDECRDVSSIGT